MSSACTIFDFAQKPICPYAPHVARCPKFPVDGIFELAKDETERPIAKYMSFGNDDHDRRFFVSHRFQMFPINNCSKAYPQTSQRQLDEGII